MPGLMAELDRAKVRREFAAAVNMTAQQIAQWLVTPESRNVGLKGIDGGRSESPRGLRLQRRSCSGWRRARQQWPY